MNRKPLPAHTRSGGEPVAGTDDAGLLDLLDDSHANSHTGSVGIL